MRYLLFALVGYVMGSIPFSFIVPLVKGVNITKVGSGNVGGTNVLRSMGGYAGAVAMILDGVKAFLPVLIARAVFGVSLPEGMMIGFFAAVGHSYSIFLKFRGGKAVACTVGTLSGTLPWYVAVFFGIWIPIVLVTQYVSLGSLLALAILSGILFLTEGYAVGLWMLAFFGLSLFRHRKNVVALFRGEERKTDLIAAFKRKRNEIKNR
ncbi:MULTISPECIES: glycerol-3-phosphate 1-O-acyltransferase PlsY [Mesotoga]|uniref:glycerol-3-phosphate 1-O-acyltransferase PlsY n=1 Tax=Mesotoga TaxID=1184396 RepID=UPI0002C9F1FB|nr:MULTISPECIES: glycerol-3-phosphate 1-O-acyltransferase PlsY [Mesotoga]MCP5456631.1 glycerol-3-phosphate 1-O-acyltransferase PlsY [Thermotogota bacterium]CCU86285.1 Glycerol-3-phosphate acyltransferase [Mesotoga infera]MCP5460668.1 glycerol-3-phosphate 1-O-acyltransferase PlsY [Thermotogota bacterium]HNQ71101.1 glycerol-3-phosphate 1-O-acyltransferase PlsY [Mesotoga prima]HNS76018.1 glycerol-3-phosphate 1-O-acyltransferase PlsY [Mesotoga prima]